MRLMLEKPSHNAAHRDVFADALDTGSQTANAADDQVNLHAGLRSAVERLNNIAIHQGIHFGNDPRRLSRFGVFRFAPDRFHHRFVHGEGCDKEFPCSLKLADAGEQVEKIGRVFAKIRDWHVKRPKIGIKPRGRGIVIARGQVHVAAQTIVIAPHHERDLGVDLVIDDAVNDVDAGLLQTARPEDVVGLVEPRAFSSVTAVTCLPFFTAFISAPTMRGSPPVR